MSTPKEMRNYHDEYINRREERRRKKGIVRYKNDSRHGITTKEIAKLLGCSHQNINSTLARAKYKMKSEAVRLGMSEESVTDYRQEEYSSLKL